MSDSSIHLSLMQSAISSISNMSMHQCTVYNGGSISTNPPVSHSWISRIPLSSSCTAPTTVSSVPGQVGGNNSRSADSESGTPAATCTDLGRGTPNVSIVGRRDEDEEEFKFGAGKVSRASVIGSAALFGIVNSGLDDENTLDCLTLRLGV